MEINQIKHDSQDRKQNIIKLMRMVVDKWNKNIDNYQENQIDEVTLFFELNKLHSNEKRLILAVLPF